MAVRALIGSVLAVSYAFYAANLVGKLRQMRYTVKLFPTELDALASLIGKPLDRVSVDGWAAELRFGPMRLSVVPEEIATPDADHPKGDVVRPLVRGIDGGPILNEGCSVLGERLGLVRAVNVVSILIGFSPVVDCPSEEIMPGVVLPQSRGYGWVYYPPEQRKQAEREVGVGSLVDLDIAFELVCDECPSLVAYACGFFMQVSLHGLPVGEDWVKFSTYLRRSVGHL